MTKNKEIRKLLESIVADKDIVNEIMQKSFPKTNKKNKKGKKGSPMLPKENIK